MYPFFSSCTSSRPRKAAEAAKEKREKDKAAKAAAEAAAVKRKDGSLKRPPREMCGQGGNPPTPAPDGQVLSL